MEWHSEATKLQHPLDAIYALTDRQARMLRNLMQKSKQDVKEYRKAELARIREMAEQFEERAGPSRPHARQDQENHGRQENSSHQGPDERIGNSGSRVHVQARSGF